MVGTELPGLDLYVTLEVVSYLGHPIVDIARDGSYISSLSTGISVFSSAYPSSSKPMPLLYSLNAIYVYYFPLSLFIPLIIPRLPTYLVCKYR
jgi:hypothetical protein